MASRSSLLHQRLRPPVSFSSALGTMSRTVRARGRYQIKQKRALKKKGKEDAQGGRLKHDETPVRYVWAVRRLDGKSDLHEGKRERRGAEAGSDEGRKC